MGPAQGLGLGPQVWGLGAGAWGLGAWAWALPGGLGAWGLGALRVWRLLACPGLAWHCTCLGLALPTKFRRSTHRAPRGSLTVLSRNSKTLAM